MDNKEYKAGKSAKLYVVCEIIFMTFIAIIMINIGGWNPALIFPIGMITFSFVKLYRLSKKILFVVSENELIISYPPRNIASEKMDKVIQVEENRLELFLKSEIPVPVFLQELSKVDRSDLTQSIENMIKTI